MSRKNNIKIPKIESVFIKLYLSDEDFFNTCYRNEKLHENFITNDISLIINHINKYYKDYKEIPSFNDLKVNKELNKEELLNKLQKIKISNLNKENYIINLEKYLKHNYLQNELSKSLKKFNLKNVKDINENITEIIDTISNVDEFSLFRKSKIVDGFEDLTFMDEHFAEMKKPKTILSTGFDSIDNAFGGGFIKNTLNVFIAGTGVGKTMFKANVHFNMAENGNDVFFIPLEITKEEMHKRIFSRILEQRTMDINFLDDKSQKETVEEWYRKINENNGSFRMAEYSVKELTPNMLEGLLNDYKKIYGKYPDSVVIDSGNLMALPPHRSNLDKHDAGEEIANQLKGIGQRCNTAMISSVQLNREGIKKSNMTGEASKTEIAGSIYWIQVADNGIILSNDPDDEDSLIVIVDKNRNTGILKKIYLKKDTKYQTIFDFKKEKNMKHSISSNMNNNIDDEIDNLTNNLFD